MTNLNSILAPGMLVRHPDHPDWGTGQVQSNIGGKVTVNFRDAGKVVIDGTRIGLLPVFDDG
ncbi:DUF3553 domain-containing protein [Marinibacterium profundimaris]|uniref:DUF3553 domain-containing protein n=1 Tax=Marinibacterium profundimaris TaxID=1679460 RepID=A0A225NQR1_9RHOB|nr:DUF3553 domain-containing protein [Marinibacterium profundimaris]OWU77291.1 hypothetical protein ATO3_00715 [Marinibacterium profundimaris]